MTRAGIVGLGLWVPDTVRGNDAWPESFARAFQQDRESRKSRDFTHIEGRNEKRPHDALFAKYALPYDGDPFKGATLRRVVAKGTITAEGDTEALRRALADAQIAPPDVDVILSSALVPDRLAPSNGPMIQHLSGCVNATGLGVEGFCSSALVQLEMAAALIESGRARVVACVQSHQISLLNDLEGPTSPIFGDGSAAFIVGEVAADRGIGRIVRAGDGALAGGVTYVHKGSPEARWYEVGGPMVPGIDDPSAARTIARCALQYPIETIRELCRVTATPIDAVAAVATMQPMVWYQPAVAEGLGISPDRVPSTYATYAHLGGAAVVANLLEARRRGLLGEGAPVILYAHGAGVTRYAALLRWGRGVEATRTLSNSGNRGRGADECANVTDSAQSSRDGTARRAMSGARGFVRFPQRRLQATRART